MIDASAGGPHTHWPLNRGFDQVYGFLEGETNQSIIAWTTLKIWRILN